MCVHLIYRPNINIYLLRWRNPVWAFIVNQNIHQSFKKPLSSSSIIFKRPVTSALSECQKYLVGHFKSNTVFYSIIVV